MISRLNALRAVFAAVALSIAATAAPAVNAATFFIVNGDGTNEGFNDSTPAAPIGGNTGTTVGQQRLIAFQYAADIWGARLVSNVTIRVFGQWNALSCTSGGGVLGSAGPDTAIRDFVGAPVPNTYYAIALANALNGNDLDPDFDDIFSQFNSSWGTAGCATASGWYYGLDGAAPANRIDFVTVLLHELAHGLGFVSFVDLASGAKGLGTGRDDAYMRHLEHHGASPADYPSMSNAQRVTASKSTGNLHWTGSNLRTASTVLTAGAVGDHVQMYAPNPSVSGSSVSHFDTALTPNQLMEPSYTVPLHEPNLELQLFNDVGWTINYSIAVTAEPPSAGSVTGAGTFTSGTARSVGATPASGYAFVNWTESGNPVSTSTTFNFTVSDDRTLVANFAADVDGDGYPVPPDCDDANAAINPGATEIQDNVDNDCDGVTDEGFEDSDGDGQLDTADNCPSIANPGQENNDADAQGDACDPDDDNDTVADAAPDNCPLLANTNQADNDNDAQGDACDSDDDNDGIADAAPDNCRFIANASQADTNGDGQGDACDRFTITLTANPTAGGTVTGGGSFPDGASRTVKATAKSGYKFVRWTQGGVLASILPSYSFTLTANRNLQAQFRDPKRRNDLLIDFGTRGLYRLLNKTGWAQINTVSPIAIAAGDLDGSLKDEAIASISGTGAGKGLLARFNNGSTWTQLHATAPQRMAVGDFDGNGKDDLAIDLGSTGLFVLRNNTLPFAKVRAGTSQGLAAADLDGNGKDELIADLSNGLFALYNANATNAWTQLFTPSPARIATGDLDGNGKPEVIIDRGSAGLFARFNNAGSFTQIHTAGSEGLATGDLDGNGKVDLLADRGATGLFVRMNNGSTWTQLTPNNPLFILAADIDKSGKADVIADFGSSGISVRYNNAGGFVSLRAWPSQGFVSGGFD